MMSGEPGVGRRSNTSALLDLLGFGADVDPLSEEQEQLLFDRKIAVNAALAALANIANIAAIIGIAVYVIPPEAGSFQLAWAFAAGGSALVSLPMWLPVAIEGRRAGTFEYWGMMIELVVLGTLNGVLALRVYPLLDGVRELILIASLVGIMGAGAMALSTMRSMGYVWVLLNGAGLAITFILNPGPERNALLVQLSLYVTALLVGVTYLSASFEKRCRAEIAAEADRAFLSVLLDDFEGGSRDWLWRTDNAGALVEVSSRFAEQAGRSIDRVAGLTMDELIRSLQSGMHAVADDSEELFDALRSGQPFRELEVAVCIHGVTRWWSLSGATRRGEGRPGGWRGIGADVTDERTHHAEMVELANADHLTGLPNRRRFAAVLPAMLERHRGPLHVHLGILDLDDFKTVNDTLGHAMGDALLVEVGRRLESHGVDGEFCARLGGDEFAIVLDGGSCADAAKRLASYLDVLAAPFTADGAHLRVQATLGHASLAVGEGTPEDLVVMADLALHDAKNNARGGLRPFDPRLQVDAQVRAQTLSDLRDAIDRSEFVLHYQPKVDIHTGAVVGFEALVRWRHPTRGVLAPGAFIDLAEETGMIVPIGEQVLDMALSEAATWSATYRVAVNVAPAQLISPGFADGVIERLRRHGLDPCRLDVEVTENTLVDAQARVTLEGLRRAGVGVAIDDFGTGYSSLSMLAALPATQVKIDRAFVTPLGHDEHHAANAIVQAIMDITKVFGHVVVAEGVETRVQRAELVRRGCHQIQGYLIARPMPASDIGTFLSEYMPDIDLPVADLRTI